MSAPGSPDLEADVDAKVQVPPNTAKFATLFEPDSFVAEESYYSRVLNAQRHPLVSSFMGLSNDVIAARYCHLHPSTDEKVLLDVLKTPKKYFNWAGVDLFSVTDDNGKKQMIIIETNSCPSGNKSLPMPADFDENNSNYHYLIRNAFWNKAKDLPKESGVLAVVYDKNDMECQAYACALADVAQEKVYLAKWKNDDPNPPAKIEKSRLYVRTEDGKWVGVRAAFRYVTQAPWARIPALTSRTFVFNPIVCCLAGGRNKMCADKAYEFFNHRHFKSGLVVRTPVTIRDVAKREVPIWVKSMGGFAVVKNPYSNAGQGVYTICSMQELDAFMKEDHKYDRFIVQSLVGNSGWSSSIRGKKYYHTGTIPTRSKKSYCADLRMMVCSTDKGFRIVSMYARRAAKPLLKEPPSGMESWEILGTNLSIKLGENKWDTDTRRLMLMDSRDFNKLGLGLDDLIDGYIQCVLAVSAIDDMADELVSKGTFDKKLYASVNADATLINEILD
ncbi:hypothetical protein AAMO2058_001005600 [Amorphochlora amoebiformis]